MTAQMRNNKLTFMDTSKTGSGLMKLPLDTQKEILGFLDGVTLLKLARVNRHFRDLIAKEANLKAAVTSHKISKFLFYFDGQTIEATHNLEDWLRHGLLSSATKKSPTYMRAMWEYTQSRLLQHDSEQSRRRHFVKIIVIGQSGVGKTSLMHRHVNRRFNYTYKCNIGADFFTKEIMIKNQMVTAQIWDTAGQERFQSLGVSFYRGADAVIVTYDVMRSTTFREVETWINEFYINCPNSQKVPIIICGNKSDLLTDPQARTLPNEQKVEEWEVEELAKRLHVPWILTSAKDAVNVDALFVMTTALGFYHDQLKELEKMEEEEIIQQIPLSQPSQQYGYGCYC